MKDPEENYKPFYHPLYGWQWLDMNQTYEQETQARFEREGDGRPGRKSQQTSQPRNTGQQKSGECESLDRGSAHKE